MRFYLIASWSGWQPRPDPAHCLLRLQRALSNSAYRSQAGHWAASRPRRWSRRSRHDRFAATGRLPQPVVPSKLSLRLRPTERSVDLSGRAFPQVLLEGDGMDEIVAEPGTFLRVELL